MLRERCLEERASGPAHESTACGRERPAMSVSQTRASMPTAEATARSRAFQVPLGKRSSSGASASATQRDATADAERDGPRGSAASGSSDSRSIARSSGSCSTACRAIASATMSSRAAASAGGDQGRAATTLRSRDSRDEQRSLVGEVPIGGRARDRRGSCHLLDRGRVAVGEQLPRCADRGHPACVPSGGLVPVSFMRLTCS